jgi:hypothetical protein
MMLERAGRQESPALQKQAEFFAGSGRSRWPLSIPAQHAYFLGNHHAPHGRNAAPAARLRPDQQNNRP